MNLQKFLRPQYRRSRLVGLLFFGVAAACFLIVNGILHVEKERQVLERNLDRLPALEDLPTRVQISSRDLELQKKWSQLVVETHFPWEVLFRAIENSTNKQIELLELAPEKSSRQILLRGEARNVLALSKFVESFSKQPGLGSVHLSRQELIMRGKLETIAFEIKGKLN